MMRKQQSAIGTLVMAIGFVIGLLSLVVLPFWLFSLL